MAIEFSIDKNRIKKVKRKERLNKYYPIRVLYFTQ